MSNNAFALKSQMIPLTVIELSTLDDRAFDQQLSEKVSASPALFDRMPAILGLEQFESIDTSTVQKLLFTIRKHNILPVALKGTESLKALAQELDLAWIPPGRNKLQQRAQQAKESIEAAADTSTALEGTSQTSSEVEIPAETASTKETVTKNSAPQQLELTESASSVDLDSPAKASHSSEESPSIVVKSRPVSTKIVSTPVRSGQQIYAKDSDLIILAQVGQGAEVIADGNIHIYGTLRGRAIAGASGNSEARIFCQSLQAELISIAGVYQVSDDLPPSRIGQSSQIELKENHLHIDTL
jgi:septum site-determining protein MinC